MDWKELVAYMGPLLAIIATHVALFIWARQEASADRRHAETMVSAQIVMMRQETNAQLSAIHAEMKDFHGRLCAIEERNKGK